MATAMLFAPTAAQAQLSLSPGRLARAHSQWDDAGPGCLKCHALTGGINAEGCMSCHAHTALREAVAAGHGLHAAKAGEDCRACHTEHKGSGADTVRWEKVGGADFDHRIVGFALTGMHQKVKCAACHTKRFASGRTSFTGLVASCAACHQNVHAFTNDKLREQCTLCHVVGGVAPRDMRGGQVPFDHAADAGLALVGKHASARCVGCHKDKKMSAATKRTCSACHEQKHGRVYLAHACSDCHDPSRAFANAAFAHERTGFALDGKHAAAPCKACHKSSDEKPRASCSSCHADPHQKRFKAMACEQCHAGGGTKVTFAHGTATDFPLTGRHARLACRDCHRGKQPSDFERFKSTECRDCHQHKNAHRGQFEQKECTDCHMEAGSKELRFVHNRDSRFVLVGAHAELAEEGRCGRCHKKGKYRTGETACTTCHKDSHAGQLGQACERCHSPEVKFAATTFDHDHLARFPLEGLHERLPCKKCHPARRYALGVSRCVDCHRGSDPHQGKLGEACERCHTPDKGATKFEHETVTAFAREGVHGEVACGFCHRAPSAVGPPSPGWTANQPAPPVDRTFPVMGKSCAECHADQHAGRYGDRCDACHQPIRFANVRAAVHDTGAFRLEGVHAQLPCERCHRAGAQLTGLGESCQSCHFDDDAHGHALGPACGDCHRQREWSAARFSHLTTGFALRGAHRTAPCRGCHGGGTYQGVPMDCESCHRHDAARVIDPVHSAELAPCDRCHQTTSFVPARQSHPEFTLVGRHRFVRCRSCHGSGVYVGTPAICSGCHLGQYNDPSTEPNHAASGYPVTCEDCHTPAGWLPARAR